jgi:hypothetical protein
MADPFRDPQLILEDIRSCKISGDSHSVGTLFRELDIAVWDIDKWPEDFYQALRDLQADGDFLRLDNSWTLLYFINNNWERFSPQQRRELRTVIKQGFDKYKNWMGAFVTSEMLGERYADEEALLALVHLGKTARLPERALVPHGLETLAMKTSSESLRDRAIKELQELKNSNSEEVRKEARISLETLHRRRLTG